MFRIHDPMNQDDFKQRAFLADVIFWSTPARAQIRALGINEKKMRAVGTKNFGVNNGIFYNYSGADYYGQRTALASGVLNANESLRREWQGSYIDLIARIKDENGRVPIFTPDRSFISQDC